jgi:hypothetical protein
MDDSANNAQVANDSQAGTGSGDTTVTNQAQAKPMSEGQVKILANVDQNHVVKDFKFGFRTIKDEETGISSKRPDIEIKLPVLGINGIIAILESGDEKQQQLLLQAVEDQYTGFIKATLADDQAINTDNFPFDKFTWEAMANEPPSERRGRGIAKEIWEAFIKSYIAIMPGLTGKTADQVKKQAAILGQKLQPLKNHEDKEKILPKFKEALTIYTNSAPDAEQYEECITFLNKKVDDYLNADKNADLGANLGFE